MITKSFFSISYFLAANIALGFSIFEPSVECTVIKIHSTTNVWGLKQFPRLYQSINNDPMTSTLVIAGNKFPKIKPETMIKTDNFEKISIRNGSEILELELKGKPVSRNGTLKKDGKLLADITCH